MNCLQRKVYNRVGAPYVAYVDTVSISGPVRLTLQFLFLYCHILLVW